MSAAARKAALDATRTGNHSVRVAVNQLNAPKTNWRGEPNDRESAEYWDSIDELLRRAMTQYGEARRIVQLERSRARS